MFGKISGFRMAILVPQIIGRFGHLWRIYSNPGIAMLAYCVTRTLQKGPYKDIRR